MKREKESISLVSAGELADDEWAKQMEKIIDSKKGATEYEK